MSKIAEIKEDLEDLKTEKAVLEDKKKTILKTLERKYGIKGLAAAKKSLPTLKKKLKELEKDRDLLIAESLQKLSEFEDAEI